MMMTDLMSERMAADESFVRYAREMPGRSTSVLPEERPAKHTGCERLAVMTMPELLYYVIVGGEEIADELA